MLFVVFGVSVFILELFFSSVAKNIIEIWFDWNYIESMDYFQKYSHFQGIERESSKGINE